jgi:hypothetical protein
VQAEPASLGQFAFGTRRHARKSGTFVSVACYLRKLNQEAKN